MKKLTVITAITLAGGVALAVDMGSWFCKDCLSFPPPKQGLGVYAYPEALRFLTITNVKAKWEPLDTVSVCNGRYCLSLVYLRNGVFLPADPKGTSLDAGTGYKNPNGISGVGGGGGERGKTLTPAPRSISIGIPIQHERSGSVYVGEPTIIDMSGNGSGRHVIVK